LNAELAEPWLERADGDLDVARRLDATGEVHPSYVCFHAQQAAEKALKALLAASERDIPRTHDLLRLLGLLPELALDLTEEAALLTPYAVASRYPDDNSDYDENSGSEAISGADRIQRAVQNALALGALGGSGSSGRT
jgi:HEPN domain-containing protein